MNEQKVKLLEGVLEADTPGFNLWLHQLLLGVFGQTTAFL